jgi:hypothetical protein
MRNCADHLALRAPRFVERFDMSLPKLNPTSRCVFAFVDDRLKSAYFVEKPLNCRWLIASE